jgi:HEAT repeat protein
MNIGAQGHAQTQQTVDDLSIEASLARHKVALDKSSLIKALQNPDSTVRWLAATKLASEKDNNAIALILAAEQDEKEPEAKTNMAYALALAGNDEGFHALRETCKAGNQTLLIRLRAAKYLARMKDDSCLPNVLEMIRLESKSRQGAILMLPLFRPASNEQRSKIREVIRACLFDREELVRSAAASALADLKDVDGMQDLTRAIANERVDFVRQQMANSLKALQAH